MVIEINAEPYFIFPKHMLPPIGLTYNFTFTGVAVTTSVAGVYAVQAVTAKDQEKIIGYRIRQEYTKDTHEILYTVSYTNGTSFQAGVYPDTQECFAVERQEISCTGWSSTDVFRWNNTCSEKSEKEPKSITKMTVQADNSDLRRPVSLNLTITLDGVPFPLFSSFQFASETKGKDFPHVKCYF
ncbi:unnamed protein product [Rotaria sp. Silwood1]|nr:unnamed protein product [Rotaria sp. Silwood1]CAF4653325.1 unnamed protein product [Rotaria sp. Silwood1]